MSVVSMLVCGGETIDNRKICFFLRFHCVCTVFSHFSMFFFFFLNLRVDIFVVSTFVVSLFL